MMAPQWLIGAIIIAAVARNPKEKLRKSKMQIITVMAKIEITDGQLSLSLSEATWVVHILYNPHPHLSRIISILVL